MTPILYKSDEIDFTSNGLGQLNELYSVDIQEQRNGLLTFTGSYPVTGQHYADISEGHIILAKPSPLDDNHAFRIVNTQLDIAGHSLQIEADSITYDLTHNLVKQVTMKGNGATAMSQLQSAIVNPSIFTLYSDITTSSTSTLNYVNPMEAIAGTQGSFLQYWGGEMKRENRRVAMLNRRGRDNVATFRLGKNINGLRYTVDTSNLVTQVIPTVNLTQGDTTRYLEGATVSSKRIGNYPIKYTQSVDVTDKITINEGDTDKVIIDRINAYAGNWFTQSENTNKDLPDVTIEVDVLSLQDSADYADKFAKLETIGLTDTVTVYVPEYGVNVTAIVNELHYDPIGERVTSMVVGTAKVSFAEANQNALSDLQNKVIQVQEQATQAVISANGKNSIHSGRNAPAHPQEGDTWFWDDGTDSGIRVFTNGVWVDSVDTKTLERINNAVDSAIETSHTYTDELNEKQVQTTNALNEKVDKSVKELTDSQQAISSQATAYTNSAVADANSKAASIGQSAAQNAQKALDEAKKDFTSSFASQASQTASMASDVTSKASQYASQAKSEAVSAATSADGVVRTEFKSTTDSMTATIQKNKSDADGKISTAQTTATQALDGLATKVSQTEYNTKTGQLQTDLTTTTQTANQAKTDIVSIKQKDGEQDEKMNTIVSDVNGTKQTVSDLQTAQGKQSGDISTLQQRADGFEATVTKVNNLSVGGRNYILNSSGIDATDNFKPTLIGNKSSVNDASIIYTSESIVIKNKASSSQYGWFYALANNGTILKDSPITSGQTYTLSLKVRGSASQVALRWGSTIGVYNSGIKFYSISDSWTKIYATFSISKGAQDLFLRIQGAVNNQYLNGFTGSESFEFKEVEFEYGNVSTDWTPAPEDLESATSKAQLTADQATISINNYKTDADGRISKAQADIAANANAITQKVSQSDYNTKTGELTQSVSKAQQTADSATQTIGNYQTSNDKRVKAAETSITQNTKDIALRATAQDLDDAKNDYTSKVADLKISVDEITSSVSNNSGNGIRYLRFRGEGNNDNQGTHFGNISVFSSDGSDLIVGKTATTIGNPAISGNGLSAATDGKYNISYIGIEYNANNHEQYIQFDLGSIRYDVDRIEIGMLTTTRTYYSVLAQVSYDGVIWNTVFKGNIDNTFLVGTPDTGQVIGTTVNLGNSNAKLAATQITVDGINKTVTQQGKDINSVTSRIQTAEGTISKAVNNISGLQTTVTQTANGLTQEIKDRTTGDDNTLQSGKDFTTSQIKSYDQNVQTKITQTADSIAAQVSANGIRYVRFNGQGNNDNNGVHFRALKVIDNKGNDILSGKSATASAGTSLSGNGAMGGTDGRSDTYISLSQEPNLNMYMVYDLGSLHYDLQEVDVSVWTNTRTYYSINVQTSADGKTWHTIFNENVKATGGIDARIGLSSVSNSTVLSLLKDNFQIGIKDNIGNIISGINGDTSGLMLTGKHIFLDGEVTAVGKSWLDGAVIKDATIGRAQIADLSVDSSKIINLDVNKITGNVANFIRAYWDGRYGSTSIDSDGMTVSAGLATTVFDKDGMKFNKSNRSIGRIGVNDLYQDFSKKGLYFGLESTGDFMAWGAQNYAGNPYTTKLSWFRTGAVPSNLPGLIEGFNFEDNVSFLNPIEVRGGIKMQGANDKLLVRASNLNGGSYPTFGATSAYFVYAGSDIYLSSNGTAINLTKIIKAFGVIRTAAIPTSFNSNGTAAGWYNVNMG